MPETHVAHDAQEYHDAFDTCLLTDPFWSFFDPSTEAAAILLNAAAACQADDASPMWVGRGLVAAFINTK